MFQLEVLPCGLAQMVEPCANGLIVREKHETRDVDSTTRARVNVEDRARSFIEKGRMGTLNIIIVVHDKLEK
jgi:hypothetical protein